MKLFENKGHFQKTSPDDFTVAGVDCEAKIGSGILNLGT